MGEQTRQTLRDYFRAGQLPTENHFGDLIDSMLNMKDEGFRKSPDNGLELSAPTGHQALLSFYRDHDPLRPVWGLGFSPAHERLQLHHRDADEAGLPPALTVDAVRRPADTPEAAGTPRISQRVGVGTETPQHTLDVAGVLGAQGRIGTFGNRQAAPEGGRAPLLAVPADGQWHPLVDKLGGCQAFEVMAGVGAGAGNGRFALLHAVALNAYNPLPRWTDRFLPRRGISTTRAHYGRRCDRLQLRWHGTHGRGASYALQIRTGCDYGGGTLIRFALTRLWFDPTMADALP